MSVTTGLISGIDYDTMITQLMQIEANPQTLLKNKLIDTKADAAAYRAVNTTFDALRSAAEALTKATTWAAAKATSTSADVVATAAPTASPGGSVTFSVTSLAATHTLMSQAEWSSKTAPAADTGPGWPLTITDGAGKTATVSLPVDGTITDAAGAINSAGLGVKATVVQLAADRFRLQLTSTIGGADGEFVVESTPRTDGGTDTAFLVAAQAQDATLDLGNDIVASSATNTFTDLVPGVTITVAKADPAASTTVKVDSDPAVLANAVKTMVSAANTVLSTMARYADSSAGSTAVLKGDSTLRSLTTQVLDTISTAIGGTASASSAGLKLTRDGQFTFDPEVFTAKLAADPALVQRLVNGADATNGPNQVAGDGDDTAAVQGVAQRLLALAKRATDTTTGILVLRAKGEDEKGAGLTSQIEDWDRRLDLRRTTLSAQFTAMETALGRLQSQSSWLSSQLSSLPRWSSSDS
ncbi:flagellar filament capping protein FliD [Modestobacter sp. SYSU DS0290]